VRNRIAMRLMMGSSRLKIRAGEHTPPSIRIFRAAKV
jgi:hypothetical protein